MDVIEPRIEGQGALEAQWRASRWLSQLQVTDAESLLRDVRRVVIVSPHPDDEVLGCAGLMQSALARGLAARVVSVTDGEACYTDQPGWNASRLRNTRRDELAHAMRVLGLDASDITTLGMPDGQVARHETQLVMDLAALVSEGDLVVAPWVADAHPDHDATGRAALAAAKARGLRLLQYPVWAWHWLDPDAAQGPWSTAVKLLLSPAATALKGEALHAFATQLGTVPDLACAPILPPHVVARFLRPFEVLIA